MTFRFLFIVAVGAAACATPSASTSTTPVVAKTSTWDGVYTTAQAQHGATLFASTCDKCHGPSGAGTADDGGRLVGREFFEKFDGVTLDQLFTSIATLMPLDHPKSLAAKDVADVTAYLLQQNQMPAGSSALGESADQLKALKITATKP